MYNYSAVLVRVIDGDTVDVLVDLGFKISMTVRLRILGLDTPEIFHPSCPAEKIHGMEAKIKAEQLLTGQFLEISTEKKGKYGRYLASIAIAPKKGEEFAPDFAEEMILAGFQKKENYGVEK